MSLHEKASSYLDTLCVEIPTRRVGSAGNREATDFFARTAASFGLEVDRQWFDCIDWAEDGAELAVGGRRFDVLVSPYSLGCDVCAPLVVASTLEELSGLDLSGKIVLLRGAIAREPLMPKNFSFYNPEEHQRIIGLLETKRPEAIVAATSRSPEMAGAVYPFPLIEDGDFDIPSVYTTEDEGAALAEHAGQEAALAIRAQRMPATGCNVLVHTGASTGRRVVLFAHIDAKEGTSGATDNATGVAVLLLLAELLAAYSGNLNVEIVAMNGEDYYSAPGEQTYLRANKGKFGEIVLGINLDGVGYHRGATAYSLYGCPSEIGDVVREAFGPFKEMVEGEPWYQGDHGLFLMHETPALAITSENFMEILAEIAHTPKDNLQVVDVSKLPEVAHALRALLTGLEAMS